MVCSAAKIADSASRGSPREAGATELNTSFSLISTKQTGFYFTITSAYPHHLVTWSHGHHHCRRVTPTAHTRSRRQLPAKSEHALNDLQHVVPRSVQLMCYSRLPKPSLSLACFGPHTGSRRAATITLGILHLHRTDSRFARSRCRS
jgi:hypothetical protein